MRKTKPNNLEKRNSEQSFRVVYLTTSAIKTLEKANQKVTLTAISDATRLIDPDGKGIDEKTILRNEGARDLFHQHSLAYQASQDKAGKVKRRSASPKVQNEYKGLRTMDLIQIIEDLKVENLDLKQQVKKLGEERAQARKLQDEVLAVNTRQLAELTRQAMDNGRPK